MASCPPAHLCGDLGQEPDGQDADRPFEQVVDTINITLQTTGRGVEPLLESYLLRMRNYGFDVVPEDDLLNEGWAVWYWADNRKWIAWASAPGVVLFAEYDSSKVSNKTRAEAEQVREHELQMGDPLCSGGAGGIRIPAPALKIAIFS